MYCKEIETFCTYTFVIKIIKKDTIRHESTSFSKHLRKVGPPMVRNRTLLLIACFVWLIAGINIVRIGLLAYVGHITVLNIILLIIVFCLFWFLIFNRLVNKHTIRIAGYEIEKQYFWYFFDLKSFIIMAVMITLGINIRVMNLMLESFIAYFYTGLGTVLTLAGIKFGIRYLRFDM